MSLRPFKMSPKSKSRDPGNLTTIRLSKPGAAGVFATGGGYAEFEWKWEILFEKSKDCAENGSPIAVAQARKGCANKSGAG